MKDGWWINYKTGSIVPINEHELDIRNPSLAHRLGVPIRLQQQFKLFTPVKDRCRFMVWLMKNVSLMRVRAHGIYVTFEYCARSDRQSEELIQRWAKTNAGPATMLHIVNLHTGKITQVYACLPGK